MHLFDLDDQVHCYTGTLSLRICYYPCSLPLPSGILANPSLLITVYTQGMSEHRRWILDSHLSENEFLETYPEYHYWLVKFIHTLMQVDPADRKLEDVRKSFEKLMSLPPP